MKSLLSILFIIVTSLLLFGCGKPDLVVTTLEVTGPSVIMQKIVSRYRSELSYEIRGMLLLILSKQQLITQSPKAHS